MAILTTTISEDHTTVTVTDSTIYTSPNRAGVGVYIGVYKVNYQGQETLVESTPNSVDPGAVTSYTFDLSLDGHYRYKYIAIPDWAATTYDMYDLVFDPVNLITYRSRVDNNVVTVLADLSNTANWEVISNPYELADNVGTTYESVNSDASNINKVIGTLTADMRDSAAVDASLECANDADRKSHVDRFTMLLVFARALEVADTSAEYNKGERIARRAQVI